jgi:SAM-dependent methyltransferase
MPAEVNPELRDRRLTLYAYLEPLWPGRRVLEVGRPGAAELLRSLGASEVITAEAQPPAGETFDLVVIPDGAAEVRRPGALAAWRKLLRPGGRLIIAAANADRPGVTGGLGYYDLQGALAPLVAHVQMLGMTPFGGVGVVEFNGAVDALRVDTRLVREPEPPTAYVALAGAEPLPGLGYALVQLPGGRAGQPGREEVTRVSEVRAEEIEELRARLRRAAEDRTALDTENARLRRAVAEADETVVKLTRRTTEEMTAVADRLAAGLRAPFEAEARVAAAALADAREEADRLRVRLAESEARAAAAEQRLEEVGTRARERAVALEDAQERQRLAESELARARREVARLEGEARAQASSGRALDEKTRQLAERDERILRLEEEKQDLVWRLAELEDKLRQSIARAVQSGAARGEPARGPVAEPAAPPLPAAQQAELAELREARAQALEEFNRASAVLVAEATDLRASLAEQTALVAELEDQLAAAEARGAGAVGETTALRQTAKSLEEADRSRRARLAELEGKLLRLEHERKSARQSAVPDEANDRRLRDLETERDRLKARVGELEAAQARALGSNGHGAAGGAVARELEAIETDLRREVQRLEALDRDVGARPANGAAETDSERLANTLENYRARASRLRDDLEGIRRRLDSLSVSEISGFLEELREDLAELGG